MLLYAFTPPASILPTEISTCPATSHGLTPAAASATSHTFTSVNPKLLLFVTEPLKLTFTASWLFCATRSTSQVLETDSASLTEAVHVADALRAMPEFRVIADGTDLPVVCFAMSEAVTKYDVFDVSRKLRERGWLVPAYTMPPKREDLAVLRVVVRNGFSHDMAELFLRDLHQAIEWLDDLSGPMPREQQPSTFHH